MDFMIAFALSPLMYFINASTAGFPLALSPNRVGGQDAAGPCALQPNVPLLAPCCSHQWKLCRQSQSLLCTVILISDIAGDGLALTAIEYSEKMTVITVLTNGKDCYYRRSKLRRVPAPPVTDDLQQRVPPLREINEV
jgi:hypothetical protein